MTSDQISMDLYESTSSVTDCKRREREKEKKELGKFWKSLFIAKGHSETANRWVSLRGQRILDNTLNLRKKTMRSIKYNSD